MVWQLRTVRGFVFLAERRGHGRPGCYTSDMSGRLNDASAASSADHRNRVGRFRSAQARGRFLEQLNAVLESWPERTDLSIETSFGTTVYSIISPTGPSALGESSATPLVLLQGGNSTIAGWSKLIGPWSKTRPVIAIDTVWEAGRSIQLAPMNDGELVAQWLEEVIDALGLESLHLIGYSYGAWAALNQILHAPDRLATVTAIDPPGAITGIPLRAWAQLIRLMRGGREEALDFLAWVRNGELPPPPMRDLLLSSTLDFVKRGSPLPRKLRADDWAGITVPLEVIIAGNSQFVPRRALRTLRRHAPGIDVHVLDGIGHAVLSDAPEDTVSIVEEFISKFEEQ